MGLAHVPGRRSEVNLQGVSTAGHFKSLSLQHLSKLINYMINSSQGNEVGFTFLATGKEGPDPKGELGWKSVCLGRGGLVVIVLEEPYLVLLKAQRSLKENSLSGRFAYERPLDFSSPPP